MQHGFVKVCSATVPIKVADVEFNTQHIIKSIEESYKKGSSITVFPELCICGYTCGDLFNQRLLLEAVEKAIIKIAKATKNMQVLSFIGAPLVCNGKLYNCAVAVSDGNVLGVIPKTFLPNYGEFYEQRHFVSAPKTLTEINILDNKVPFGTNLIFKSENNVDLTVAAELCEDLWAPKSPSVSHALAGANVIVNLSCSDEIVGKAEYRKDLVRMQSAKLVCAYIYSDAGDGESTSDLVYAGHNIICEKGELLAESNLFENGLLFTDIDVQALSDERKRMASSFFADAVDGYKIISFKENPIEGELTRVFPLMPFVPSDNAISERMDLILKIQSKGLEKRISHTAAKTAVIGISGGLDSALALLITYRAFKNLNKDVKDIIAVTMPCFGSTVKTKNNALKLIDALGVTGKIIPIEKSVNSHFEDIGQNKNDYDVTFENAQARIRTLILMDLANKFGGLVIGTGDLSELALGWATYNGDHMSMYSVNCSVPKTLVKELVKFESARYGGEIQKVLDSILRTEISPELLPVSNGVQEQRTEDIIGPYILHDFFLYYAVRWGFTPEKIAYIAEHTFKEKYDLNSIKKWLKVFYKRFFSQQYKRSCVPDGVKVGPVSLSPRGDWRMPSDAISNLWQNDIN
ncbi:MAG: NAD(+) synthase [Clostridia bacterium]|nr:NAD(+) synthase [Clostridia bacterium]